MKTLNQMMFMTTMVLLTACNEQTQSPSSSAASEVTQQWTVNQPSLVVPTPTPTSNVNPVTLIRPNIIKLHLNGNLVMYDTNHSLTVLTFDPTFNYLRGVCTRNTGVSPQVACTASHNQNTLASEPTWHYTTELTILTSNLSQDGTSFLNATGTITFQAGVSNTASNLNIPSGQLYFSLNNTVTGPWGTNGFMANSQPTVQNTSYPVYISKGCGELNLYSDANMTQRVAQIGNYVDCGLQ